MRIVFFSDCHLAERPPASRNQSYVEDIFAKLAEVKEIAATCDVAIFGGDLFHAPHPPHGLVRRTIELLRDWPCPLHIVAGNHDLPADGMAGLDRTALGVVLEALTGIRQLLREDVLFRLGGSADTIHTQLSAGHWTPSIDSDPMALMMGASIWEGDIVKIKIMHAMIMTDGQDHPFACHIADEIDTDADIIICGHTHWATGPYTNKNGVLFVGPGSISRTQRSEGELKRQIGVSVLTLTKAAPPSVEFVPLKSARPASEVFGAVEAAGETRDERLDGYVASLESGLFLGGDSVEGALEMMRAKAPVGVAEMCERYLKDAGL